MSTVEVATPFADVLARTARVTQAMLADSRVIWHPSSGEAACEAAVIFEVVEGGGSISGRAPRLDEFEFLKADLPGIAKGETVTIVRAGVESEMVLLDVDPVSDHIARATIGLPDQTRPRA
jgi:hypothetical protein